MNVLVTKKLMDTDVEYLMRRLDWRIRLVFPDTYDDAGLLPHAADAHVLLGAYFSEALLQAAGNLIFAQIPWTGLEGVEFEQLERHGVVLCNSHSNARVVAEHAVALMFDAAKKLSYHDRLLRKGQWNRPTTSTENPVSPFSLQVSGSRMGFIGFGAIARHINAISAGFGCSFKAFSRTGIIPPEFRHTTQGFPIGDFTRHASDLDVIYIAIPLTDETRQLMDASLFNAMKPGVVLVNVSRGQVVHEGDLYQALTTGRIGAAAIDVWYRYPSKEQPEVFPSAHYSFHELENVVLSPHRAGYVQGGFPHLDDAVENLNRALEGRPLLNVVSLKHRY